MGGEGSAVAAAADNDGDDDDDDEEEEDDCVGAGSAAGYTLALDSPSCSVFAGGSKGLWMKLAGTDGPMPEVLAHFVHTPGGASNKVVVKMSQGRCVGAPGGGGGGHGGWVACGMWRVAKVCVCLLGPELA